MSNYLTSYKLAITKHIRSIYTFNDTTGLTADEIKAAAEALLTGAIPIPEETFDWIASTFKYVYDKDNMLVYDNVRGLWTFERDADTMVALMTDYFTVLGEIALQEKDMIVHMYARKFFSNDSRIQKLVKRICLSVHLRIRKSNELIEATENLRYFETVEKTRAIMDISQPKFNLKTVKLKEVQPLHLMHLAPVPIAVTDDDPKLWLELIDEYMLHDPERIAYFKKVLAYMMSPYNYNQAYIFFIGDGRNGKGTIVKVLQDILGSQCVRMNAELLNANPSMNFKKDDALAATEGRSLLIFNEIDERMVASTQNIKDLTEGGRDDFGNKIMTVVRPAYSRNYEVNISGIPVIIANNLLNFADWSNLGPVFKRLVLVNFDYAIEHEDPTILTRLAQEYPQIQMWLYKNYFEHKGIRIKDEPKPASFAAAFNQYRKDSDIISMFWDDCIETGTSSDRILRADIYRMYDLYCKANGRKPIRNKGTNGFANLIKPFMDRFPTVNYGGNFYISGIKKSAMYTASIENVYR